MRIMKRFIWAAVALLTACTNKEMAVDLTLTDNRDDTVRQISVSLPQVESGDIMTRTVFDLGETVTVAWANNDTLGIMPASGYQASFPMAGGAGGNTAVFDGGGWGLKDGHSYAAYYPFSKKNFDRERNNLLIDYTGQTQVGNDNSDHLGAYDFLASGSVTPVDGTLNLALQRLGSVVKLQLTIPEDQYIGTSFTGSLTFSTNQSFVKKAKLDLSGVDPIVTPVEISKTFVLNLEDVVVPANKILTVYMMLSPNHFEKIGVGLQGKFWQSTGPTTAIGYNGAFSYALEEKDMVEGKAYIFTVDGAPIAGDIIYLEDNTVREICVANWDENRDGSLSMEEAANVGSIGLVFKGTDIKSFREFQYFTGITSIPPCAFQDCTLLGQYYSSNEDIINIPANVTDIGFNAFDGCSSLRRLTIPDNVLNIGSAAFIRANSLSKIKLPSGLTAIADNLFREVPSLSRLDIPETVTSIGNAAFYFCNSLAILNLPSGVTSIGSEAFMDCSNLMIDLTIPDLTEQDHRINNFSFAQCGITSLFVDEGITTIGNSAFYHCDNLKEVDLPSTITSIETEAFAGCDKLESILVWATTPPEVGSSPFGWSIGSFTIYVPSASVAAYQEAPGWNMHTIAAIGKNVTRSNDYGDAEQLVW